MSTQVSEKEARDVAEAARETEWTLPSFGKELFLGNFKLDLIHPQPKLDPAAVEKGEAFIGRLKAFLEEHVDPANAITVTADGHYAVCTSCDHMLRVWDVETGICISAFTGESPLSRCLIAPDGQTIVAREKSGRGHFLRLEGLN